MLVIFLVGLAVFVRHLLITCEWHIKDDQQVVDRIEIVKCNLMEEGSIVRISGSAKLSALIS